MISKEIESTILKEMKTTVLVHAMAKELTKQKITDPSLWNRESLINGISKLYPLTVALEANLIIGKLEAVHRKGIVDVYLDVLKENGLEDSKELQKDFGYYIADVFYPAQIDNDDEFTASYHVEPRDLTLDEDIMETEVYLHEFEHESKFKPCLMDFMSLPFYKGLSQKQKDQLTSQNHSSAFSMLSQYTGSATDASTLLALTSRVVSHTNQRDPGNSLSKEDLSPKNMGIHALGLCTASRILGGYLCNQDDRAMRNLDLVALKEKYLPEFDEFVSSGIDVVGYAKGLAIFDASIGKDDQFGLIENSNPFNANPEDDKYWQVSETIFDDRMIRRNKSLGTSPSFPSM
jgi:hypothetical protein